MCLGPSVLRCLLSPHQVNHGGVQKPPTQVSLYKSHTTEEPLRRHRGDKYCQVLVCPLSKGNPNFNLHRSPTGAQGYVHGRVHPTILQTGKSPGPVVDVKDPTKIFYFFIFC